jgi:MFS family permease
VNDSKVTAGAPAARFEWRKTTSAERRTLIAASLGWMLDAFDVMIYSLVLTTLIRAFGMTRTTAGLLNTLTLVSSAAGSIVFGFMADRFGRGRMLSLSILTYSIATFCCGLCRSIPALAVFRVLLGLGMGGEWNTGAALVAETWPAYLRGRVLGIVQSSWALGYALAALAAAILLRGGNWRLLFFVGVLPAVLTFWIRRGVPEPAIWAHRAKMDRLSQGAAWRRAWPRAAVLLAVNAFGMFAWWGLFTWLPAYLSLPGSQGGRGLALLSSYSFLTVLNLGAMLPGYLLFGVLADRFGRRTTMISYLGAATGMTLLFASARNPVYIFVSACLTAFFGTGFFTGSGIFGNELFPTAIRATALGVSYNAARGLSALGPLVVARLSETRGLSAAFYICAAAFGAAAFCAVALPETRGTELT